MNFLCTLGLQFLNVNGCNGALAPAGSPSIYCQSQVARWTFALLYLKSFDAFLSVAKYQNSEGTPMSPNCFSSPELKYFKEGMPEP